jgi:hypothetical protein
MNDIVDNDYYMHNRMRDHTDYVMGLYKGLKNDAARMRFIGALEDQLKNTERAMNRESRNRRAVSPR